VFIVNSTPSVLRTITDVMQPEIAPIRRMRSFW
jgi:hypothetical protein